MNQVARRASTSGSRVVVGDHLLAAGAAFPTISVVGPATLATRIKGPHLYTPCTYTCRPPIRTIVMQPLDLSSSSRCDVYNIMCTRAPHTLWLTFGFGFLLLLLFASLFGGIHCLERCPSLHT